MIGAAGALALALVWILVLTAQSGPSSPDAHPAGAREYAVSFVFDGDTVEARPVGGDPADDAERLRLIGIDTPEGTPEPECGADAARDRLRALLPENVRVWGLTDQEDRDRYGRLLVYIWTEEGVFVNEQLVREGLARTMRIPPNTTRAAELERAEQAAEREGAGTWSACP